MSTRLNAPTFEQMKAFLVERYKHERLYGVAGWRECPNYGDVVVNSAIEILAECSIGCVSQFESNNGNAIWYVFESGQIQVIDGESALARAALRQSSHRVAATSAG